MLWLSPTDVPTRSAPGAVSRAQGPAAEEAALLLRIRTWRIGAPGLDDRVDEATVLSRALGISKVRFRAFERALNLEVAQCAHRLSAEPLMARQLKSLPLRDGDTVVGLGDEHTSDRRSWFEVLAAIHRSMLAASSVRFVNLASPGQTTGQMLDAMETVRGLRPRIVLCMPGMHDARRAGRRSAPTTLSLQETDRNLFEMRSALPSSQWLWIVPPAHRSIERVAAAVLPQRRYCWIGTDCDAIRSLVRAQDEQVVDPYSVAALDRGSASGHEELDPLLSGRRAIVRAVLQELAS